MMGDTGVAVNPEDEKFKHLIGKKCILPIMNREIPIVGDEYCEIGFGTGAVKMTPAHDPNDFEVGLRHNLEVIRVIADDGHINENGGKYNGMDRYECRKAIVADLEAQGYLVKTEPYSHNVGTCYRCHNDVEPLISAQWFVKMAPLAKEAIRVVEDGTFEAPCNALKKNLKKLCFEQKRLARMTKFGKNWHKQKERIAKLHQHIANIRKDFLEKLSLKLCKNHAVIVREDLKIKNMTASAKGTAEEPGTHVKQKSGLNRAILDQGWGLFFAKLDWKAQLNGGTVIKVPPAYTSQTCPVCGHCEAKNRPTQAKFKCLCCGHTDNADHVAALNILARGLNRVSACGEFGGNARAQVNSGRLFETGSGQQQEPIEEITRLAP